MTQLYFRNTIFILGILVALLPAVISAQVAGGGISGRVTDSTGAVIPGAKVEIRNIGTGAVTQLVSNDDGIYRAANLLPGGYEVKASAPNFESFLQKGIVLTVGADLSIDLKMSAGGVAASVTVSEEIPQVDTTTPTISSVVSERTIVELPLNGRDWTSLATLQPGISSIRTQYASGGTASRGNRGYGDELTITGHRPQENNYRIDGVSINDYTNGAPGSAGGVNLGADAVKEFSVLASNYTAEYGRTSGGVINAITRSGTNALHGSAYEFFRNDALDARNFFDRSKPALRRNQFGGSLGGPIIKNRTFFFADYEGIRRTQGVPSVVNVPSAAARAGNLCTIPTGVTPNCTPTTVVVNPLIVPFFRLYPLPNSGLIGNGDTGIYATSLGQTFNEDFFTTRVDHRFSETDNLSGTFLYDNGSLTIPDALNNAVFPNFTRRRMVAVEETHIFSQNLVNSVRFGFSRSAGDVNVAGGALNPAAADLTLGTAPGRAAAIITIPGINDAVGVAGNSSFNHLQNSYQLYDDAFLTVGNHSLKFGAAFESIEYQELSQRRPNGRVRFRSLADFLQDNPRDFFALDPSRSKPVAVRSKIWAGYLNDSWRYSSRLNLTLGVRYEMSTIPTEKNNGFLAVRTPSGPLVNVKKLFDRNPTLFNFEPRVGFAYDVFGNGKTSVRAGFGIYDALPLPWIFTPKEAQGTPFNTGTTLAPTGGLPQGSFPGGIYSTINFNTAPLDVPFTELRPKRNYIMNWNATLQHQLISNLTMTAAYVGSRGVHMAFGTDEINIVLPIANTPQGLRWPTPAECTATPSLCNRLNPYASQVRGTFWDGNSFYNGLQLQLIKRLSQGFQAQVSYTYSKCIDDGSEASRGDQFLNGITSPLFIEKAHRRGRCAYDLRHVFVANALYNIPGPKDGVASLILGNWQLGGILSASSGVPFSVIISGDPLRLKGTDANGWPDYVPGCKIENPSDPLHYINTACFTAPNPLQRLGNAGRNIATGPKLFNLDMAVYKNIPVTRISEGFRIQLRFEAFNVLNHTNFAPPLANNAVFGETGAAIASAGRITSTQTSSRQIQLGLRINW
ncbi:MAG: carboxypeptidase regulatory-like domain-containing protein [Acidobacteriota bacterium]